MMNKPAHLVLAGFLIATGFSLPTTAQSQDKPISGQASEIKGEVKKINTDAQKITLKHAPIPNLDMGEMTMVFRVSDPKMLTQVKEGDTVKFKADRVNGALTIIEINKVVPEKRR